MLCRSFHFDIFALDCMKKILYLLSIKRVCVWLSVCFLPGIYVFTDFSDKYMEILEPLP